MSSIYDDYPVMITEADVTNNIDKGFSAVSDFDRQRILRDAHSYVYDFLIYPTYNADIKNKIIEKYAAVLEKPLKRALLEQAAYLIENRGDVGRWNGVLSSGATADNKDVQTLLTKAICPKVINILMGAPINLLYAGG